MRRLGLCALLCACLPAAAAAQPALPPPAAPFDYQIGGAYPPAAAAQIIDRDRSDPPVPGRYNVCYVNAFQSQVAEDGFWRRHPKLLIGDGHGSFVQDPGYPGEYILNIRGRTRRRTVAQIVGRWIDGCARSGYQAVEPDNLDSFSRSKGHLREADDAAFARLMIARAHARGLAIAQKNASELAGRLPFDFAITEECQVFSECAAFTHVYGHRVIEVEYTDAAFQTACATRAGQASILRRDRDVAAAGRPGYVYRTC